MLKTHQGCRIAMIIGKDGNKAHLNVAVLGLYQKTSGQCFPVPVLFFDINLKSLIHFYLLECTRSEDRQASCGAFDSCLPAVEGKSVTCYREAPEFPGGKRRSINQE